MIPFSLTSQIICGIKVQTERRIYLAVSRPRKAMLSVNLRLEPSADVGARARAYNVNKPRTGAIAGSEFPVSQARVFSVF